MSRSSRASRTLLPSGGAGVSASQPWDEPIALNIGGCPMQSQRLYRSKSDRMIAGVCGGLARYFSVDATLVRLVFLLILFLGGAGFLVYLILWIIMPEEDRVAATPQENVQANTQDLANSARELGNSLGQAVSSSSADAAQTAARQGP